MPVVGSLLLDCFFPFDPYLLEETKEFVDQIYRPYTREFIYESDEEESSDGDVESEEEDVDTPDSGLGDSVVCLNNLLMQDLVPASHGFH